MSKFDALKAQKCKNIDIKTEILIEAAGFSFDGVEFLLNPLSREKWLALKTLESSLSWPVTVSAKVGEYSLAEADLDPFLAIALGIVQTYKDSGRALRLSVQTATTWEEFYAIQDNRT